ncbi:MAG: dTMP kinase [Candidatus Nanoperiomorbaceae bacterium]
MTNKSGKYIVIEGQDGTGKSTQAAKLAQYFSDRHQEVIIVEEPGGIVSTDQMRTIIKNRQFGLDPMTNVLLFTAARRELWLKKIAPALRRGITVLSSRNWWSTLAYQHFGEGVIYDEIVELTRANLPKRYFEPDAAVILTLSDAERAKRLLGRDDKSRADSFESRGNDFQDNVNRGYAQIAHDFHIPTINGNATPDVVFLRIRDSIMQQNGDQK